LPEIAKFHSLDGDSVAAHLLLGSFSLIVITDFNVVEAVFEEELFIATLMSPSKHQKQKTKNKNEIIPKRARFVREMYLRDP